MPKLKCVIVLVCLTFLTGCNIATATTLISSATDLAVNLWDRNTYYTKECLWYEQVELSDGSKEWIRSNEPPDHVVKDLSVVAKNNDIYREVCPNASN